MLENRVSPHKVVSSHVYMNTFDELLFFLFLLGFCFLVTAVIQSYSDLFRIAALKNYIQNDFKRIEQLASLFLAVSLNSGKNIDIFFICKKFLQVLKKLLFYCYYSAMCLPESFIWYIYNCSFVIEVITS